MISLRLGDLGDSGGVAVVVVIDVVVETTTGLLLLCRWGVGGVCGEERAMLALLSREE